MRLQLLNFRRAWASLPLALKGLTVIFVPLAALLVTTLSYFLLDAYNQRAEMSARHASEVRRTISDVQRHLAQAESHVRGYLHLGLEHSLEPFAQARASLISALEQLEASVADRPTQLARLEAASALVGDALSILEALVAAPAGLTPETQGALLLQSQALLGELWQLFSEMEASEETRLAEHIAAVQRTRVHTVSGIVASVVFGIGGGLLATLLFTSGISQRIWTLERNARRLANGRTLLPMPWGDDEIGHVGRELERTSRLLERKAQELKQAQLEALERLAQAADYRDDQTGEHTRRVGDIAAAIAEALGLPQHEVELLRRAAPLHDVGKIGIPDEILLKPGKLSASEFAIMQGHTTVGARILQGGRFELMKMAETIAMSHHERWDGSGYPLGLKGEAIPLPGRIVAVADVMDALLSRRPYKAPWPLARVLDEIERQSGRQFDPAVVAAFNKIDWHAWAARQQWLELPPVLTEARASASLN
jgi:putative nucleotidyltransferase with HDIG domain